MTARKLTFTLIAAALTLTPGAATFAAQTGVKTETQERMETTRNANLPFNIIGLLGLFGLLGFRRPHTDDSYHPSPVD